MWVVVVVVEVGGVQKHLLIMLHVYYVKIEVIQMVQLGSGPSIQTVHYYLTPQVTTTIIT